MRQGEKSLTGVSVTLYRQPQPMPGACWVTRQLSAGSAITSASMGSVAICTPVSAITCCGASAS